MECTVVTLIGDLLPSVYYVYLKVACRSYGMYCSDMIGDLLPSVYYVYLKVACRSYGMYCIMSLQYIP